MEIRKDTLIKCINECTHPTPQDLETNPQDLYNFIKYLFYLKLLLEIGYYNTLYYEIYINELIICGLECGINIKEIKTLETTQAQELINKTLKHIFKNL